MMATLSRLLGEEAPIFRRYLAMALLYGVLSGLTIAVLTPVLLHLLHGDWLAASRWLALLLAGVVACWLWRRRVETAGVSVGIAVLQEGRRRIGDHVASLPVGWFSPENIARLNHAVTHGMMEVAQLPAHVFTPVLSGMVAPVVIAAALCLLDWRMGLIALAALPVMAGIFVIAARFGRHADAAWHRSAAETGQRAVEFAQSQSVLRAFGAEGGGVRFLEEAIERQHLSARRLIWLSMLSVVLNAWVVQAVFAALLITAGLQLETIQPPERIVSLLVALVLVNRFVEPLLEVAGYGEALRAARNQLEAIETILEAKPLPEPAKPRIPLDGSIELQDVTFRYAPDQPAVLQSVNLRIEPGSMVALVGASGSGKTTLARLIARFFDVDAGRVTIGGVDLREIGSATLSGRISQVFQETWLFQGTIADNIRMGHPKATDAEVIEAACLAGVDEIVARLPEGFGSQVGEGGTRLSGGERQRIAIARALIKPAPIMLIDEATAALDAENQAAIARTLSRLRGRCTMIVIAHQLSTIRMADRVIVLDKGRIAEQGTPSELAATESIYARFLRQGRATKGWRIGARA